MTDERLEFDERDPSRAHSRRYIPVWKRVLLVCAVLAIGLGFALPLLDGGGAQRSGTSEQGARSTLSTTLLPQGAGTGSGAADGAAEDGGLGDWSPFLVKGGFSFVVGFCLGYALRAFFKVSAIVLGVIFLALFALQHFEIVAIDWSALEKVYDDGVARFSTEFESLKTAMNGSLPSAALAGVGLFTGFKGRK